MCPARLLSFSDQYGVHEYLSNPVIPNWKHIGLHLPLSCVTLDPTGLSCQPLKSSQAGRWVQSINVIKTTSLHWKDLILPSAGDVGWLWGRHQPNPWNGILKQLQRLFDVFIQLIENKVDFLQKGYKSLKFSSCSIFWEEEYAHDASNIRLNFSFLCNQSIFNGTDVIFYLNLLDQKLGFSLW